MPKFNPDFWEVTVSDETWARFSTEDHLYHEEPGGPACRRASADRARRAWPEVRTLIDEVLTARQREVLILYFLGGLNQQQVAEKLDISQQAVSEHLYGRMRNGRAVGGALRKLRKACARRGVGYERG